ncbi:MAG: DUF2085 domain-containing protein [Anaerolineales bacterium]|nr:DUF2085 domain-containing protein [Anaerolineales bacterium]
MALPFLAPLFMHLGLTPLGNLIYMLYSFTCHQLPQRSFFLFGPELMLSLSDIQSVWQNTNDPLVLRQFTGSPELGWKVAWSDRMVWMYTSIPIFAVLWAVTRPRSNHPRPKFVPVSVFLALLLPMAVDGSSHFISDLAGIGNGFRDSNAWLAQLTNHAFATSFYAGDGLGSFNFLMRALTGIIFGFAVVWFGYPYLEDVFSKSKSETGLPPSPPANLSNIDQTG